MTRQPLTLAIWPTTEPTAPDAAATTSVSPGCGLPMLSSPVFKNGHGTHGPALLRLGNWAAPPVQQGFRTPAHLQRRTLRQHLPQGGHARLAQVGELLLGGRANGELVAVEV